MTGAQLIRRFVFFILFLSLCAVGGWMIYDYYTNRIPAFVYEILETDEGKRALETRSRLADIQTSLPTPGPGDWLYSHDEDGQTLEQYLAERPTMVTEGRNIIYVQPLGDFTPSEEMIMEHTITYLRLFFVMDVQTLEPISLDIIPDDYQREHQNRHQVDASYILHNILEDRLPDDAAAYIGLTATDLYPKPSWNFVFGLASYRERVGVWSIQRYGDPSESEEAFKTCLLRAMGTASHETAHMFTISHCTAHSCCMNGSGSLEEADEQVPFLCNECLSKLQWNIGFDPVARYENILAFWEAYQLSDDSLYYKEAIKELLDPN